MTARTSTSIALQEMKRRLKEQTERADRTQQFFDAMVAQRDKLEELTDQLADQRDADRREITECHAVFDKLERKESGRMYWESNKPGSLPGRLALSLASIRA